MNEPEKKPENVENNSTPEPIKNENETSLQLISEKLDLLLEFLTKIIPNNSNPEPENKKENELDEFIIEV